MTIALYIVGAVLALFLLHMVLVIKENYRVRASLREEIKSGTWVSYITLLMRGYRDFHLQHSLMFLIDGGEVLARVDETSRCAPRKLTRATIYHFEFTRPSIPR